jgi:hypothetical protein
MLEIHEKSRISALPVQTPNYITAAVAAEKQLIKYTLHFYINGVRGSAVVKALC